MTPPWRHVLLATAADKGSFDRAALERLPKLISEIEAYAAANGRRWKSALNQDWVNARSTGELHALRNSHGPSWLAAYKLPVAAQQVAA